jgi:hypothetical protein
MCTLFFLYNKKRENNCGTKERKRKALTDSDDRKFSDFFSLFFLSYLCTIDDRIDG